jgi:hypothetical protein
MGPYEQRVVAETHVVAEFFARTTGAEMAIAVGLHDVADEYASVDLSSWHLQTGSETSAWSLGIDIERRCTAIIASEKVRDLDGPVNDVVRRAAAIRSLEYQLRGLARGYHEMLTSRHDSVLVLACHTVKRAVSKVRFEVLGGLRNTATRPLPLSDTELVCEMVSSRVTVHDAIQAASAMDVLKVCVTPPG